MFPIARAVLSVASRNLRITSVKADAHESAHESLDDSDHLSLRKDSGAERGFIRRGFAVISKTSRRIKTLNTRRLLAVRNAKADTLESEICRLKQNLDDRNLKHEASAKALVMGFGSRLHKPQVRRLLVGRLVRRYAPAAHAEHVLASGAKVDTKPRKPMEMKEGFAVGLLRRTANDDEMQAGEFMTQTLREKLGAGISVASCFKDTAKIAARELSSAGRRSENKIRAKAEQLLALRTEQAAEHDGSMVVHGKSRYYDAYAKPEAATAAEERAAAHARAQVDGLLGGDASATVLKGKSTSRIALGALRTARSGDVTKVGRQSASPLSEAALTQRFTQQHETALEALRTRNARQYTFAAPIAGGALRGIYRGAGYIAEKKRGAAKRMIGEEMGAATDLGALSTSLHAQRRLETHAAAFHETRTELLDLRKKQLLNQRLNAEDVDGERFYDTYESPELAALRGAAIDDDAAATLPPHVLFRDGILNPQLDDVNYIPSTAAGILRRAAGYLQLY